MDERHKKTLERVYQLFLTCSDPNKKEGDESWTIKEILGHLLDSLSNNHQRLSRYIARDNLDFPAYDQEVFVERAHYDTFNFKTLLSIWYQYNHFLLHMMTNIPTEHLTSTLTIGDRPKITLADLVKDYFAHMELHEQQVRHIIETH
jgi:hypothetical protein